MNTCCCCAPGYGWTIAGGVIGIAELILAAVYNFHAFGFIMGIIILISSAGFAFHIFKAR